MAICYIRAAMDAGGAEPPPLLHSCGDGCGRGRAAAPTAFVRRWMRAGQSRRPYCLHAAMDAGGAEPPPLLHSCGDGCGRGRAAAPTDISSYSRPEAEAMTQTDEVRQVQAAARALRQNI